MKISKKEAAVVIGCVVFLLANLGAIGAKGRQRAKDILCLANLGQWGKIFEAYTNDHDGYFMSGIDLGTTSVKHGGSSRWNCDGEWIWALEKYYSKEAPVYDASGRELGSEGPNILRCPTATRRMPAGGESVITFIAWGGTAARNYIDDHRYVGTFYGSYGVNRIIYNFTPIFDSMTGGYWTNRVWRTSRVSGADMVPMLSDCAMMGGGWSAGGEPPVCEGAPVITWMSDNEAWYLNRHDKYTNCVFVDGSVRKTALKALWKLHWDRMWWQDIPMYGEPDWPEWMKNFPEE